MNIEFAAVTETTGRSFSDALTIATEETLSKNLPGSRFRYGNGKEAKLVNLNVFKGMRPDDKRIRCVAKPHSKVYLLNG